jgi:indole-3-acetate monooxygenase
MTTIERPTSPFETIERIAPILREHADDSERGAQLAQPIVDALIENGLYRLLAPKSLGGSEVDPITWFKFVEALARIDGSTGWCMFINGATGITGKNMPEADAEALIGDPRTVIAGTVFPFGRAQAVDGGYMVNGRWSYASGCKQATWLFGFCTVFDGDAPRMTPFGPEIRMAGAPASDVTILDTWDVNGLCGTGSHDIVLENLFVKEAHAIPLVGQPNRHYEGALYRLPVMTLFAWPMGAVALGIAQHSIDIMLEKAQTKVPAAVAATDPRPLRERSLFHLQLSQATSLVRSARAWLHEAVGEVWDLAQAGEAADLDVRTNLCAAAVNATHRSREAVELMYLAGGGAANYRSSPLQRCLRDIHAVSQHAATSPTAAEGTGAMLAGMPPPNPLLLL